MYRLHDGFMQILHSNLFGDPNSVITTFKQDKRHRKCYVTNNKGVGKVLNIQNGVCLKTFIDKTIKDDDLDELSEEESDHNSDEEADNKSRGKPSPIKNTKTKSSMSSMPTSPKLGTRKAITKKKSIPIVQKSSESITSQGLKKKTNDNKPVRKQSEMNDMILIWEDDIQ